MPLVDEPADETTEALVRALKQRFGFENSILRDRGRGGAAIWCVTKTHFDAWFNALEAESGLTLGRRLAHAAAESDEALAAAGAPLPTAWFSQLKKRLAAINADWALRGIGQLEILEAGDTEQLLLVQQRIRGDVAAGSAASAWERIHESRFRFQWADGGAGQSIIELTPDARAIPSAKRQFNPFWSAATSSSPPTKQAEAPDLAFEFAYEERPGEWTVEGRRRFMLAHDLFHRFEQIATPHFSGDANAKFNWGIEDADSTAFFDAVCEAERQTVYAEGHLVLIDSVDRWHDICRAHLSSTGMGHLAVTEGLDGHGGVRLKFASVLHPALVAGTVLALWERAHGRNGKVAWLNDAEGHVIDIAPQHEIA